MEGKWEEKFEDDWKSAHMVTLVWTGWQSNGLRLEEDAIWASSWKVQSDEAHDRNRIVGDMEIIHGIVHHGAVSAAAAGGSGRSVEREIVLRPCLCANKSIADIPYHPTCRKPKRPPRA